MSLLLRALQSSTCAKRADFFEHVRGRGLLSSTSQLNLSALCGIGGARGGCSARVRGVLGGVEGV